MYDVFISFKNSDAKGNKTTDSMLAERLHSFLTGKGLKVFFSEVELERRGIDQYKKAIDDALDSSKILIAVGCSRENLESRWVRYEWDGFINDMLSGTKKEAAVYVFFQDMELSNLPRALRDKEAFNALEKNSLERIYNYITNSAAYKHFIYSQIDRESEVEDSETAQRDTQTAFSDSINFEFETLFLRTSPKEKKDILRHIEDELNLEEGHDRYNFFYNLLNEPSSDSVSMIEINIARKYFARETNVDKYEKILNQDNPMELIIEEYFEKLFAALEDPELGLVILYSLCNCGYSEGLTISDFKNLTFAPKENIDSMLSILKKQEIIRQIKNIADSPYIMTHDYLTKYLEGYCSGKLSEQIITNIRFYCSEKNKRRNKAVKNISAAGEKAGDVNWNEVPLSLYYRSAINKKTSSNVILFCIRLLCAAIFFVCVMQEIMGYGVRYFQNVEYEWNPNILALTVLANGCAIFYIYHYLFYFAKIFFSNIKSREFWICVLLIIWGMTAVILTLLINEFWALWLAIEWMMIGILHLSLSGKISKSEKARDRLKGEGFLYVVIALVFIAFNIFIMLFLHGFGMILWLTIFIIFVFFTIRQHINTDFILAKLGNFVNYSLKDD